MVKKQVERLSGGDSTMFCVKCHDYGQLFGDLTRNLGRVSLETPIINYIGDVIALGVLDETRF